MKTIIATALTALALAAPAAADTASDARAFFALGNDSAAERIAAQPSKTVEPGSQLRERAPLVVQQDVETKTTAHQARAFFALGNDSAAERHVN